MKLTIEKVFEKVKLNNDKRKGIDLEIEELAKAEAKLAEECQAAVTAGNVDAYIQANTEKERISAALYVKRNFKDGLKTAVSEADALEAWSNYAGEYNKKLDKALSEFYAERDKLLEMYSGFVSLQGEACKTRDNLAGVTGISNPEKVFEMQYIPCLMGANDPGAIKMGNWNIVDPYAVFYAACQEMKAGVRLSLSPDGQKARLVDRVFSIVVRHKAG